MRYAIFGNVNGNEQQLSKFIEHSASNQVDQYVCLGNIVRAPEPNGATEYTETDALCLDVLLDDDEIIGKPCVVVAGANELPYLNHLQHEKPRVLIARRIKTLIAKIRHLNPKETFTDFVAVHSWTGNGASSAEDAFQEFSKPVYDGAKVCFVGQLPEQTVYRQTNAGKISEEINAFGIHQLVQGKKWVCAPGKITAGDYMILEISANKMQLEELGF